MADLVQADRGQDGQRRRGPRRACRAAAVIWVSGVCCDGSAGARPAAGPGVGGEDVVDGERAPPSVRRGRQGPRQRGDDVGEAQPSRRGTRRRRPRWRRCRPPGAVPPRSARLAGQATRPGTPRRRAGRTPRSRPASSRPAARRRAPGPARRGRARSGAACSAGWPGPGWSRRRTRPSSGRRLVGCTTTSMRSKGMPKSRCASITSRPLLTRVAELMVMTGPMSQVGCASACSAVTSASSSAVRPRNGPPLAVSTSRRTSSARPPRRHWASAECSESTGTIWPGLARPVTSGPPMISDSLLASARVVPASSAASVGRSPTAPVIPLSTTSQARPAASVEASSPSPEYAGANSATCCANSSGLRPARGQPDDPEPVRVLPHQVERLGADRPGRPQHHHVTSLHPPILPIRRRSCRRVSLSAPLGHHVASQDRRRRPLGALEKGKTDR